MKSIFDTNNNRELIDRINKLHAGAEPVWGKMKVGQMLAHCQQPLKVAIGEAKVRHSLMGKLFGRIAKKQLLGDKPMKRNLPTDPTFVIKEDKNFEEEKSKLVALLEKFKAGPSVLTEEPHPFFGKLTTEEWDLLSWKHLDHHLQQFGV